MNRTVGARERHAGRCLPAGTLKGTQQRAEQLPAGQAARTGGELRNGGEVGGEKGVRQLSGDHRLRHDPPLRAGGSGRGLRLGDFFGRRRDAEVPKHFTLERPGRVGDAVLSASSASSPASWTAVVARMAAMPSRRLSCSARLLSLPAAARTRARSSRSSRATAWNLVRTAGVTRPRRAAASTSRTVRASIENDVAAVTDAPLLPRGGTASARLALAWSSHRLLLWNAGAPWPRQHAAQSRSRGEKPPEHRAWCSGRRADSRISKDQRSGPGKRLTRTRSRRWAGW